MEPSKKIGNGLNCGLGAQFQHKNLKAEGKPFLKMPPLLPPVPPLPWPLLLADLPLSALGVDIGCRLAAALGGSNFGT